MARSKSRWRWVFFCASLVVGVVWLEARYLGLTSASDQLAEQLRLAHLEGLPVEPNDLRRHSVPDSENAANGIMNLYYQAKALPDDPWSVLTQFGAVLSTDRQLKEALMELEPLVPVAESFSLRPNLDLHCQWERGPDLMFPELSATRESVRWMVKRSHFEAVANNLGQAERSLIIAARLVQLISEVPTSIAFSWRIGSESQVLLEVANLARQLKGNQFSVRTGEEVLSALGPMPDPRFSLGFDVVQCRIALREIPYWEETHSRSGPMYDDVGFGGEKYLLRIRSVSDLNDAIIVANFRAIARALPKDLSNPGSARSRLKKLNNEIENQGGLDHLALGPTFDPTDRLCSCLARRRVVQAGLEILMQKTRVAEFPATWAKAGPDGIDPFTGKPLIYRRTPNGFVVYSVDRDGKDDGGRPYPLDGDDERRQDISFEYPKISLKAEVLGPPKPRSLDSGD